MARPRCPVCGEETNSFGQPFVSEWAVATHVAGKIKHGFHDALHEAWARRKGLEIDRSLSVIALGKQLLWAVHEELEAARAPAAASTPLSVMHDIEIQLHGHIKHRLQAEWGTDNDAWWVEGVPLSIREDCVKRREADPARDEPYNYICLIDLKGILDKNWPLFESDYNNIRGDVTSKKGFLELLVRLNELRNRYSYPARAPRSDSQPFANDFGLVTRAKGIASEFCRSQHVQSDR